MTRKSPNFFALGFALLYLVCMLFLPMYVLAGWVSISGMTMMQFGYSIIYLPMVMALVMAVSAMILDPKVSIGIGALAAVLNLVFMLMGSSILTSGAMWAQLAIGAISDAVGVNVIPMVPITAGIGNILCIVLALGFVVIEVLLGQGGKKKPTKVPDGPLFDEEVF